jgi:hypothetical protein
MTVKPFKVYSLLYEATFACDDVHEDSNGNPILVCNCESLGIKRMLFRPSEVQCNEAFNWKMKPVEFAKMEVA